MKQLKVSTPPPPPEYDLSDDDLLVIKSAVPAAPVPNDVMTTGVPVINDKGYSSYLENKPPDESGRTRIQFKFWLNARDWNDYSLSLWLDSLKGTRQLTSVIRDALRLYRDLRAGQYTVLRELFPGVVERVIAENCTASAQFDRLLRELSEMKTTPSTGPQPLKTNLDNIKNLAPDDDVKLDIKKAKSDGSASQNFLDSAFSIARQ
jgi:hypothetical protein